MASKTDAAHTPPRIAEYLKRRLKMAERQGDKEAGAMIAQQLRVAEKVELEEEVIRCRLLAALKRKA